MAHIGAESENRWWRRTVLAFADSMAIGHSSDTGENINMNRPIVCQREIIVLLFSEAY